MKKSILLMIVAVMALSVTVFAQPGPGGPGRGPGGFGRGPGGPGSWRGSEGKENIGPWVQRMMGGSGRGFEGTRRPDRTNEKAPAFGKDKGRPEHSRKPASAREKVEQKASRSRDLRRQAGKGPQRGQGPAGMNRGQRRGRPIGFHGRGRSRDIGRMGHARGGRMGQGIGRGRGIGRMGRGMGRGRGIGQMGPGRGPVGPGSRISTARRAAAARAAGPFGGRNPGFGNKRGPFGDGPGIGGPRAEMFKKMMQLRRANMSRGSRPFGPMGSGPR